MSIVTPEHEFVSKFLTLATLTDPVLPKDYKRPLQEVNNLGVALPALKYKYHVKRSSEDNKVHGPKLTFKSIKAPKFILGHEFSQTDTVREAKEYLISEGKAKHPAQLRLLLKGKVLHDNGILSEFINDEATITVMISKLDDVPQKDSSAVEGPLQIPWEAVGRTLAGELKNPLEAEAALKRLKRGWDLTK